jgi:SAM-dependent methyltransferase
MPPTYAADQAVDTTRATEHWEARSPNFSKLHPRLSLIGELVASLPERPRTALDVGCGPGTLRAALPAGTEYFGIDIAPTVVAAHGDPAHFEVGDLNDGARCFEGRTFDLVVCSGIFEYMRDPAAFVDFVVDRTRVGGHVVLTYMNRWHYREVSWRLRGRPLSYPDPHANFITIPDAARLLRARCRLVARRSMTAGSHASRALARPLGFPLNILNRQYIFLARRER